MCRPRPGRTFSTISAETTSTLRASSAVPGEPTSTRPTHRLGISNMWHCCRRGHRLSSLRRTQRIVSRVLNGAVASEEPAQTKRRNWCFVGRMLSPILNSAAKERWWNLRNFSASSVEMLLSVRSSFFREKVHSTIVGFPSSAVTYVLEHFYVCQAPSADFLELLSQTFLNDVRIETIVYDRVPQTREATSILHLLFFKFR